MIGSSNVDIEVTRPVDVRVYAGDISLADPDDGEELDFALTTDREPAPGDKVTARASIGPSGGNPLELAREHMLVVPRLLRSGGPTNSVAGGVEELLRDRSREWQSQDESSHEASRPYGLTTCPVPHHRKGSSLGSILAAFQR